MSEHALNEREKQVFKSTKLKVTRGKDLEANEYLQGERKEQKRKECAKSTVKGKRATDNLLEPVECFERGSSVHQSPGTHLILPDLNDDDEQDEYCPSTFFSQ